MATCPLLPFLAALALAAPPDAVDLRQIDRSIAREPVYASQLPKYCLLVLGPEMRTRVWLVLDGTDLYLDRNGNGDVTEPGERVALTRSGRWSAAQAGTIMEVGGPRSWNVEFRIRDYDQASGKCAGFSIVLDGQKKLFVGFDPAHPFRFAHRAVQAPIVHLEGPLQIQLYGEPPTLVAGDEVELNIMIGTPGLGEGSFCAIQCCTVLDCKVAPTATVSFPPQPGQLPPPAMVVPIGDD